MTNVFTNAEDWLNSVGMIGVRMGLERTKELFRRAGDPGRNLFFIHVAGSNGKGSVCAYLEAAFRSAGFRTGFYSSPHLISPRERFRINGEPVSSDALDEAAEAAKTDPESLARVRYLQTGLEHAKRTFDVLLLSRGSDREAFLKAQKELLAYRRGIAGQMTSDLSYLYLRERSGSGWHR